MTESKRGTNANSLKALAEHRNRNGQKNAQAVAFTKTLRDLLVQSGKATVKIEGKQRKRVDVMIESIWRKAMLGESWAVQLIWERIEGKVTQDFSILYKKMTDDELRDFIAQQLGIATASD